MDAQCGYVVVICVRAERPRVRDSESPAPARVNVFGWPDECEVSHRETRSIARRCGLPTSARWLFPDGHSFLRRLRRGVLPSRRGGLRSEPSLGGHRVAYGADSWRVVEQRPRGSSFVHRCSPRDLAFCPFVRGCRKPQTPPRPKERHVPRKFQHALRHTSERRLDRVLNVGSTPPSTTRKQQHLTTE